MTDKQPTAKEIEAVREKRRAVALKNLTSQGIASLAIAYHAQDNAGYGENDNNAVDEFLYRPAIQSGPTAYDFNTGQQQNLLIGGLLGSRQGKKRYTGEVKEFNLISSASKILMESLQAVKVEDIAELTGTKLMDLKEEYKNKYVADLLVSENEEEQEFANTLLGGYVQYITAAGVSKAVGARANSIKGGLEKLLVTEDKK